MNRCLTDVPSGTSLYLSTDCLSAQLNHLSEIHRGHDCYSSFHQISLAMPSYLLITVFTAALTSCLKQCHLPIYLKFVLVSLVSG